MLFEESQPQDSSVSSEMMLKGVRGIPFQTLNTFLHSELAVLVSQCEERFASINAAVTAESPGAVTQMDEIVSALTNDPSEGDETEVNRAIVDLVAVAKKHFGAVIQMNQAYLEQLTPLQETVEAIVKVLERRQSAQDISVLTLLAQVISLGVSLKQTTNQVRISLADAESGTSELDQFGSPSVEAPTCT